MCKIKRGSCRNYIFLVLFILVPVQFVCAQNNDYEKFNVGLNFAFNSNNEMLHNYWKPGVLYETYLKFPINYGALQTGISYIPFKTKNSSQPNFDGLFIYAQWDKKILSKDKFDLNAGFRFGLFRMIFESTPLYHTEDEMQEHEIFAGIVTSLNYKLTNQLGIIFKLDYLSILTRKKINLVFVGSGFYYKFDTPQWLKDFLK